MLSVMKHEVEPVLVDIADWIDEAFAKASEERENSQAPLEEARPLARSYSLVKAQQYKATEPDKDLGSADLGAPLARGPEVDMEDNDDGDDILSFSTKKSKAHTSESGSSLGSSNASSLTRTHSIPRFTFSGDNLKIPDYVDESSMDTVKPSKPQRGSYAFFTQRKAETPSIAIPAYLKRASSPASADKAKSGLSEAELMRRRRVEAVYGMDGAAADEAKTFKENEEDDGPRFRW